jgi:multidrug efflux pump subunit AcrA (membrane-fusion protein)
MTARVDIEVASIARAVILPARAVFEREGQPHCVVLRRGNPQLQPVTVDGDNGLEVAIRQGVKPGERVLLTDPSSER